MSRILEYVAQINAVPASEGVKPFVPGPDAVRFRVDEVKPWPLAFGPSELAPAFRDGFFLVPKLGQFEDEAVPERSEEHTSELQSRPHLVCRLLLEKKNGTRIEPDYLILVEREIY